MENDYNFVKKWDERAAIVNGSYDLKLASAALLTLCEALDCRDFKPDNEQLYSSIMLAVRMIEEVYLELDKIEIKEMNSNE